MVFSHTPTKRRSIAEQKKLFQKAGVYHALPFGFDQTHFNKEPLFVDRNFLCSLNRNNQESLAANSLPAPHVIPVDTWEKLLVLQSEFSAYNAKGMQRADPQGERWCGEKQCFDYTPFVTRADWLSRFREQHQREINAAMLRRARTLPHRWISSQWACGPEAEVSELSNGGKYLYGSSSSIWQSVVPGTGDAQQAFATAADLSYSPTAPYEAFTRADWERNCQYWNTQTHKEVFDRHRRWDRYDWLDKSPPKSFWETWCSISSWAVPPEELLWVGGTYARHPSQFPAEQSQPTWVHDHLRPLGIQPPRLLCKLRQGARIDAHDWNLHLEDEEGECDLPFFPFSLTPVQQESMLSAFLWKHALPSVWYGEGAHFELRRERYKRIKFYADDHRKHSFCVDFALRDFLDVVHRRRRDRFRQPLYETWADESKGNKFLAKSMWHLRGRIYAWDETKQLRNMTTPPWATAPVATTAATTTANTLKLEGMMGPGLVYLRQLVIPANTTVVDILSTLKGPLSQAGAAEPGPSAEVNHAMAQGLDVLLEENDVEGLSVYALSDGVAAALGPTRVRNAKPISPDVEKRAAQDRAKELNDRIERESNRIVDVETIYETAQYFIADLGRPDSPAQSKRTPSGPFHSSSRLGIDWTESAVYGMGHAFGFPYVFISSVEKQGLVPKWNKANPEKQIVVGSRIIEVNGERVSSFHLSALLHSGGQVCAKVVPKSSLDALASSRAAHTGKAGLAILAA